MTRGGVYDSALRVIATGGEAELLAWLEAHRVEPPRLRGRGAARTDELRAYVARSAVKVAERDERGRMRALELIAAPRGPAGVEYGGALRLGVTGGNPPRYAVWTVRHHSRVWVARDLASPEAAFAVADAYLALERGGELDGDVVDLAVRVSRALNVPAFVDGDPRVRSHRRGWVVDHPALGGLRVVGAGGEWAVQDEADETGPVVGSLESALAVAEALAALRGR